MKQTLNLTASLITSLAYLDATNEGYLIVAFIGLITMAVMSDFIVEFLK